MAKALCISQINLDHGCLTPVKPPGHILYHRSALCHAVSACRFIQVFMNLLLYCEGLCPPSLESRHAQRKSNQILNYMRKVINTAQPAHEGKEMHVMTTC